MGVLNRTPDSFSDGGVFVAEQAALEQGRRLQAEGAAILDIGGESTRPGAEPVSLVDELARVVPLIERLSDELPIPISVDTSKPDVMRAAVQAGAGMINDVLALRAPGALETAAELGVPVCLMHMQGEPRTMQQAPRYGDVVDDVRAFLGERVAACEAAGIPRHRVLLDPGFGFGKTLAHNLALLAGMPRLAELGCPLLIGVSRKSMIGALTERPVEQRLAGSLAAAVAAVERGAAIVRAHDVAETVDALGVIDAIMHPPAD